MKRSAIPSRNWCCFLALAVVPTLAAFSALALVASAPAVARNLPGIDVLRDAPIIERQQVQDSSAKKAEIRTQTNFDSRLDVPTFLWGQSRGTSASANAAPPSTDPVLAARSYLAGLGGQYRLSAADAAQVPHLFTQTMPNGAALVKFRNRINDIEVFREDATVLLGADRSLIAIGGYVMSGDGTAPFKLSAISGSGRTG